MSASTTEINNYSFIWSIDNIALNPMSSNKMIWSPTFSFGGFGFTKWRLVMYPRGTVNKKYISLYLHRQYGGSVLSDIAINFKLSLDSVVTRLRSVRSCCNVSFKENEYWGYSEFVRIDSLAAIMGTSLTRTFTVRCVMSPSDQQEVNLTSVRVDLTTLSENLKSLYESQQLSDVVLRSNNVDFRVHKAILSARSPKMAQFLGLDDSCTESSVSTKDVSYISAPVLKTLLFFLYSGELDIPLSAIPSELFTIASQYELSELIQKMRTFPEICIARTYLNVEHKSIIWNVKNICSLKGENLSFVHVIPTTNVYIRNIIAYCGLLSDSKGDVIKLINASFRLTGLMKEKPVFLKCRMGTDIENNFWELHNEGHLFEHDEEWKVSFSLENSPFAPRSINRLAFEFDLCDGVGSSIIQDSWTTRADYSTPYNDYIQLSEDLEALLSNGTFSDVSIICGCKTFEAHKVILAARSPVFEKMFEHNLIENQNGVINIPDVRPAVLRLLLSYMYRGIVEDLTYEDARDLYEAADKYRILVLKEKCAAILISQMTYGNAEEIASLADMHFDLYLQEKAVHFLSSRNVITCKLEKGGEFEELIY